MPLTSLTAEKLRCAIEEAANAYLNYNKSHRNGYIYNNHGVTGVIRVTQLLTDCSAVKMNIEETALDSLHKALQAYFTSVYGGINQHSFTAFLMEELKKFELTGFDATLRLHLSATYHSGWHQAQIKTFKRAFNAPMLSYEHTPLAVGKKILTSILLYSAINQAIEAYTKHSPYTTGVWSERFKQLSRDMGSIFQQRESFDSGSDSGNDKENLWDAVKACLHPGLTLYPVNARNYSFVRFLMEALKNYDLTSLNLTNLHPLNDYQLDHHSAVRTFIKAIPRPSDHYHATVAPAANVSTGLPSRGGNSQHANESHKSSVQMSPCPSPGSHRYSRIDSST